MAAKSQVAGSVVAGFPSPAEQYLEPPLDLNELLVKRPNRPGAILRKDVGPPFGGFQKGALECYN